MRKRLLAGLVLVAIALINTGCGTGRVENLNEAESPRGFSVSYSDKWEQNINVDPDYIELLLKQNDPAARVVVRRAFDAKEVKWDNLIKPMTGAGWSVYLINRRVNGAERWFEYKADPADTVKDSPVAGLMVVKKFPQSWLVLNFQAAGEIDADLRGEFTEIVSRANTM